ncbi:hypothetical protein D3C72_2337250 [compost metagenome]
MADAFETECAERALDRLALGIENAVLEGYGHACLDHSFSLPGLCYFTSTGPVPRSGSFSLMMPRRLATS